MLAQYMFIIIVVLWIYQRWKNREVYEMERRLNSGVKTFPLLGNSYIFLGDNESRMEAFKILGRDALKNENGLTSLWHNLYGYTLYTVVADPVAAEFIMKATVEKDHTMNNLKLFLGNSSIFAPASIWKPRRKILIQVFAPKNTKHFIGVLNKHSTVLSRQLVKVAGTGTMSIWKYLTAYTMDSIAESTLGINIHAQSDLGHPLLEAFDTLFRIGTDRVFSPWLYSNWVFQHLPAFKKGMKLIEYIRGFVRERIKFKREEILMKNNTPKDNFSPKEDSLTFLELLLRLSEDVENYDETEIMEELIVLLMAGNDTSAVAFSFVCLILSRYLDVQEKVYEELKDVFGDSERSATSEDLLRLRYLDAVIKETLRLYPSVPAITRKIEKEIMLPSGFKMVAETGVIINIWAIHRNPRYWGNDAEEFRPERFIDTPLKHPAAFMPFSFGPRNCVGFRFAMTSLKIGISTVLRHFKILPQHDLPSFMQPPIRLEFDLMMKDVDKFQIRLEHRAYN